MGVTATIIAAAAASGASIYAANKTSDAATNAATLSSQANTQAIDFQKQQAESAYLNSEITRKANYEQWVPSQQRLSSVGELLGMPARNITEYVPGVDPAFTGNPAPPTSTTSIDPSKGDLTAQITSYLKSQGVSDAIIAKDTPYWVGKWSELLARGKELNDPNYAMKRLSAPYTPGGGTPPSYAPTTAPVTKSVGSYLSQPSAPNYAPTSLTPPLTPPAINYPQIMSMIAAMNMTRQPQPQSVGDMFSSGNYA